jgi:hypothetical protein
MSDPKSIYEMDLEAIELEELVNITDSFTLGILRFVLSDHQIRELDEKNLARSVAFKMCMRYCEAMKVLAHRAYYLHNAKENLNKLLQE